MIGSTPSKRDGSCPGGNQTFIVNTGISVFLTDKKGTIPLEISFSAILRRESGPPDSFEVILAGEDIPPSMEGPGAHFRCLPLQKEEGWFGLLRRAAAVSRYEILAFTDSHCIVDKNWMSCIHDRLGQRQVVSGAVDHGNRFIERFSRMTTHGEFSALEGKIIANIFDGNFVIRKETLKSVLPALPLNPPVSDGAGALLLARTLTARGIPVYHEPGIRVFHESETFLPSLRMWFRVYGPNTLIARSLNPSLPGSRFMDFPRVAPLVFALGRWLSLTSKLLRKRRVYGMKAHEIVLSLAWLSVCMVSYGLGMMAYERKLKEERK